MEGWRAWAVSALPVALAFALAVAFGDAFGTWMLGGGGARGLVRMAGVGLLVAAAMFLSPRPLGVLVGSVAGLVVGMALFANVVSPTPDACRDGREVCENVGGLVTAMVLSLVAAVGAAVGSLARALRRVPPAGDDGSGKP